MRAFLSLVGLVVTLAPALADPPVGVRIADCMATVVGPRRADGKYIS